VLLLLLLQHEVANQDHSMMLGVEAVDNILLGTKEPPWWLAALTHPDIRIAALQCGTLQLPAASEKKQHFALA
jgi:hypothetical protein